MVFKKSTERISAKDGDKTAEKKGVGRPKADRMLKKRN